MSPAVVCMICEKLLASSVKGQQEHMRRYHGVSVTNGHVPMDPALKAVIVARVEQRLAECIVAHGKARICAKCGLEGQEGYWMEDGSGICDACVREASGGHVAD